MTKFDLQKINSISKYPSILTYHQLGEKGKLKEERIATSIFDSGDTVELYEMIDGENARIVFYGDGNEVDYVIGSREELLYAKGDRIGNVYGNIADYFKFYAENSCEKLKGLKGLVAVYFESYGGKTSKSKQYTSDKTQYGRMFDVFTLNEEELADLLEKPLSQIASWRDNGGQPYLDREERNLFAVTHELPVAPLVMMYTGAEMPVGVEETFVWLSDYRNTKVGINFAGLAEGVIARTNDRQIITKIRFEDYERTLKRKQK